jgi:hypothetical protein
MDFDIGSKLGAFPFSQNNGLGVFVSNVLGLAITLAGVLFLIYLIWSGIEWILSGGEKAGVEAARNKITNALIGLVIVVAAWAIFSLLKTFLGLPNSVNVGGSGGGGGTGGGTGQVDCCSVVGGNQKDPIACCKQISDKTPQCISNRYRSSMAMCQQGVLIDWGCWTNNYPWPNPGNNPNDPCKQK